MSVLRRIKAWTERRLLARHRRRILSVVQGGEGLHLDGKILVAHGEKLRLGRNVHIGHGANLNCLGGVSIGDHTAISGNAAIYSYDHSFKQGSTLPFDRSVVLKPVGIGKYVWIGMNVTIAPGTTIGDGVVIGIGAVVSGVIPDNAIVVSPKPRIVGYRDAERTAELARTGQFYQRAA